MHQLAQILPASRLAIGTGFGAQPALSQGSGKVESKHATAAQQVTHTATAPAVNCRAKGAEVGGLRALSLMDTPFSAHVITQHLLLNQQASTLGDFQKNDPSAQVGNGLISFATLRGFLLEALDILHCAIRALPGLLVKAAARVSV